MYTSNHIFLSVLCFSILFLVHHVVGGTPESLVLSCGSKDGGKDADDRLWEPDTKYLSADAGKNSITSTASYQDPSIQSPVPYMDARIFTSEVSYTFPVKSNTRYWVRFHFYPSVYTDLNIDDSYFSVIAGGVTLLKNFSASITAQALTQAYLIREFSLAPIDSPVLNVTFKPSDRQNAFAFINGIELIPMPNMFDSALMVGFSDQSFDAKTADAQTLFRLNVGGQYIAPVKDSGDLGRAWYDDVPYIFGGSTGVNLQASDNFQIQYKDLPEYSAPVNVYKTARAIGPDSDVNKKTNQTWLFPVDANFTYIVRLHFCEFQLSKINQRVFNVYINNQTAEGEVDIIAMTGEKGVPTYKDYAVFVNERQGDEEIRLEMSPSDTTKPEYFDMQLNGLEIFKVSDGSKNLAGPNPVPSDMLLKYEHDNPKKDFNDYKKSNVGVIGGAAGGAAAFGLVCAICVVVYQRKKRILGTESHTSSWLPVYGNSHTSASKSAISGKSNASTHLSSLAQGLCRHFSWTEMKQATKNFDESNVIGVGGFGKVYKGIIDGGVKVAIKRSNPQSEQGVNEFQTEIEMLSKLRHKHLVSLIGFCEEDNEMCLVYDYMALGTLREHVYNCKKSHLSWKQRLEICIGAARGLHYLHTGAKYTIIHRDVKTTNILLDENWVAKVSDFGLSKTGPNMENGHVSTVVKGSFGYLDPEYFKRQQLTEKSDVYSFGVVLFEVLCARPALNPSLPKEQVSLADWALHCQRKGTLEDIIDTHLKGKITPECLKKFADTAEKCLSDHGFDRPSMGDVLWNLEFCLQLQDDPDGSSRHGGEGSSTTNNTMAMHYNNLGLDTNA
ncbi:kinase family protein [Tripterygium wilfordii]|uniref:non-specific serine/threonine protein kinase n=1 Tax=Tripterygium wilfordii TaxID=458696 RepID=A0A7J7CZM3_TRIWF|nr:receptor-like protein kinase ANXUR2 [Tripterygium wilfordii]KAF5739544.1 kinase family protein [Tripterygium wilfordii]